MAVEQKPVEIRNVRIDESDDSLDLKHDSATIHFDAWVNAAIPDNARIMAEFNRTGDSENMLTASDTKTAFYQEALSRAQIDKTITAIDLKPHTQYTISFSLIEAELNKNGEVVRPLKKLFDLNSSENHLSFWTKYKLIEILNWSKTQGPNQSWIKLEISTYGIYQYCDPVEAEVMVFGECPCVEGIPCKCTMQEKNNFYATIMFRDGTIEALFDKIPAEYQGRMYGFLVRFKCKDWRTGEIREETIPPHATTDNDCIKF